MNPKTEVKNIDGTISKKSQVLCDTMVAELESIARLKRLCAITQECPGFNYLLDMKLNGMTKLAKILSDDDIELICSEYPEYRRHITYYRNRTPKDLDESDE